MLLSNAFTKEVTRDDLFGVYLSLSFHVGDLRRRARISIDNNDYVSYSWIKSDFEDLVKALSSPIFAEWEDVRKEDRADFPQFTFTDWLDRSTAKYAHDDVVFSDGSLISTSNDVDVPF